MLTAQQQELALKSSVPVANAADMVARIIGEIAGNDISTTINGAPQSKEAIVNLACQRIVKTLTSKLPVAYQNPANIARSL